jgi:hypothetical protein
VAALVVLNSRKVKAGRTVDNQSIAAPAGVRAVLWTVSAGDPANPAPQDIAAWIEWSDGGVWRELGRFVATDVSSSTGRADVRGDGLRWSLQCNLDTTVSALIESV